MKVGVCIRLAAEDLQVLVGLPSIGLVRATVCQAHLSPREWPAVTTQTLTPKSAAATSPAEVCTQPQPVLLLLAKSLALAVMVVASKDLG